jgi:cobalt-zinc-cadmium efflux system outer membrane protein
MYFKSLSAAALLVTALTGCASDPQAALAQVQDSVTQASGHRVSWWHGGQEEAEAQRAVTSLLSHPLTADRAARIALLNNRSLQARFEGFGISYADFVEAGLPQNPSLSGSWRFPGSPPSAANVEYSIAEDLLSLLLLPAKRKIAARELEVARAQLAGDVLGLVADTKTAFYTVQAGEQLLASRRAAQSGNEGAADLSKRQHDAGNITDLDLSRQQAGYFQAKIDVDQTQAQLRSDRERLNRLLGAWGAQTNWKTAGALPPIPEHEISLDQLESKAVTQRLDLAAARLQLANLDDALGLKEKTRFFPGGVKVGVDTERETGRQRVTGPTLDLELPLFNFGQAARLRLRAQRAQATRDLEAMTVNARSEVREARDLVQARRDLAKYHRDVLLPQRRQIVEQTLRQYNAMQMGPLELFSAKGEEWEEERAYIEARRDYWVARTALERALHGSASSALSTSVPPLRER